MLLSGGAAKGQATGTWSDPIDFGAMAIHMMLLPNKNLLICNRHRPCEENGPEFGMWEIPYSSGAYDGDPVDRTPDQELFCAGHVHLPDGRLFLAGGHEHHDYHGLADTFIYDPTNGTLTEKRDMWERRWYPTCILLPSGRRQALQPGKTATTWSR